MNNCLINYKNYEEGKREGVIFEEDDRVKTDCCRRLIFNREFRGIEVRPRVEHAWSLSTRVTTGLLCSRSPFLGSSCECAEAIAANCTGRSDLRLALVNAFLPFIRPGGRKQSAGDDWLRSATCLGRYQVHRSFLASGVHGFRFQHFQTQPSTAACEAVTGITIPQAVPLLLDKLTGVPHVHAENY